MALYYNLVFGLLVIEMAFFAVLSLPFPRKIRRTVLVTLSAPFRNEQFQIALKCILGFILVLFIDSVNRVYTVTAELSAASDNPIQGYVSDRTEVQARRFYAQRNMYLCGFTLFLTLILTRTYSLVAELIVTKDKLDGLKADNDSKKEEKPSAEVAKLQARLKSKEEELDLLKEQASNLSKEYDDVSTQVRSRKA